MTRLAQPDDPRQEMEQGLDRQSPEIPPELQASVELLTLDQVFARTRSRSLRSLIFGSTCCAVEMTSIPASRLDSAPSGLHVPRKLLRQNDVMIVAGTVTKKMAPFLVRLYNQMAESKYVIAMGACAISGGPFKEGYNVIPGVDRLIPVDIYIPGCPPSPAALLQGITTLQARIDPKRFRESPASPASVSGSDFAAWGDLQELVGPQEED
jgi:NADH-quinone oxidoreductase subunit B